MVDVLDNWKAQVDVKIKFHKNAATLYQRLKIGLSITTIILSEVASLVGTIIPSNKTSGSVYIFLVVIHWLVTTMVTISTTYKFESKQQKHFLCFEKYSNLYQEIQLASMDREQQYIHKIENDFSDINLQEPELPCCFQSVCCKKCCL